MWKPLEPGEPIGVVALSGPVDAERLGAGLDVLSQWGHPIVTASNLGQTEAYLAGTDSERLAGLHEILTEGVRWIVAARGGYGVGRLLSDLPWRELAKRDVKLIGFSDLTAVLNPLAAGGSIQFHGPMVAAGLVGKHNSKRLRSLLYGELESRALFRFPGKSVVSEGRVTGPAFGGNLTLLTSLLGTPWEPDFDGCVLFLEEVDEPLYRLDRMLTHLRSSGRLRNVKALIGGSLRGCRPATERSEKWRELLQEAAPNDAVIAVDLPFGHGATNLAFPIGATVEVDTDRRWIKWR